MSAFVGLKLLPLTPGPENVPPEGEPAGRVKAGSYTHGGVIDAKSKETIGTGLTLIVNVTGVPVQDANVGVTVTVEVPLADGVNVAIFPEPEAPRPIAVLVFVQV